MREIFLLSVSVILVIATLSFTHEAFADLGSWTPISSYPTGGVSQQSCVTGNGNLYCIGGIDNNGHKTSAVNFAPLQPNGGFATSWQSTTDYGKGGIAGQSCVSDSGYVYCVGGFSESEFDITNQLFFAPLETNGVGSWQQGSGSINFGFGVAYSSCVADSGYMYCIGGLGEHLVNVGTNTSPDFVDEFYPTDTVFVNQLSPTSGIVNDWGMESSGYGGGAVYAHSCVANNGYIYCVGGDIDSSPSTQFDGSVSAASTSTTNQVWYAQVMPNGGLGKWQQTTSYGGGNADGLSCVADHGDIVCTGGNSNQVWYAPLSSSGVGAWQQSSNYPVDIWTGSCATDSGNIYCVGGVTGSPSTSNAVFVDSFNFDLKDSASCSVMGGIWNSTTNSCAVTDFSLFGGESLTVESGTTLVNQGNIANNGHIIENGAIDNSGNLTNAGLLVVLGDFSNPGKISNSGSIEVTNINNLSGLITNTGAISNSGSITAFSNAILNKCPGSVTGNPPSAGSIQYSPCAPLITSPSSGSVVSTDSVTLSGTSNLASNGGSPITIFVSDNCYLCDGSLATTTTDSNGAWSVAVPLSQGTYNLYALATTNSLGYGATRVDSTASNFVTVTVGHTLDSNICTTVVGGTWNSTTNTCTVSGSSTIQSGNSFQIGSGVTLDIASTGSLANYGSINNDGTIDIANGGTLVNQNGGTISDSGFILPSGSITNDGTLNISLNNATCTSYPMEGTSTLGFINTCHISPGSKITILSGATLSIPINWIVDNKGTISNLGTIDVSGTIKNNACGASVTGNAVSGNPVDFAVLCPPVITTQSSVDLTNSLVVSGTSNLTSNGRSTETITIFANGTSAGSTTTDTEGNWSIKPGSSLSPGFYEIYASSSNSQGGISTPSNSIMIASQFLNQQSCQTPLGGMWNSNNTCTISTNFILSPVSTLEIPHGTTLTVSGSGLFTNNGTLQDSGKIINDGGFTNTAIYTVETGGGLDNYGQLVNGISFRHSGVVIINSGGTVNNFASGAITSRGIFENSGVFDNAGTINCSATGSCIQNAGAYSNSGSITLVSTGLENEGTFTNVGSINMSFSENIAELPEFSLDGGSFNNNGTLSLLDFGDLSINTNAILTNGKTGNMTNQFRFEDAGILNNYGILTNAFSASAIASGSQSFSGLFNIFGSANNYGTITNFGNITNNGVINNHNAINDVCTGKFINSGTLNGNPVNNFCDSIPPTTKAVLSGTVGSNSWYTSSVSVSLNAVDNTGGSGAKSTSYSLDGGPQTTYSVPFTVTGDANHTLAFNSTDNAGNVEPSNLIYVAIDTTPPVITVPSDVTEEATGPLTSVVLGTATAIDTVDGPVTVTDNATANYPVGITAIRYSATDLAGNTATAYQKVTITDTTPPVLQLPTEITVQATGPSGTTVSYKANATDLVDGLVTPVCSATSGSTFVYGNTTVTCTATDIHGNKATGAFDVNVQNKIPPELSIASPSNNAIVNTATVPVSGTASDVVSVSTITWKVDSGAVSAVSGMTPGPNVIWSFTTGALAPGSHTIQVNATDSAGLVAISTISITYAAPTDSISSPEGGGQITFTSSRGGFTSLDSIQRSSLPIPPPPGIYPLGFFSWDIAGFTPTHSVTVTVTSPVHLYQQSHYFKLVGNAWVSIPVTVRGNTMTFTITDNGPFDGNPITGVISDPAGVADPTDGRVTGGGNIGLGTDFGFEVTSDLDKSNSIKGTFEYQDKYVKLNMHSNDVSFLSVDPTVSQATIIGTTNYDRNDKHEKQGTDYALISTISDPDKTGEHDTFSITITNSTGFVVYQNAGIVKGHIEIHKFFDHDDKSDSGLVSQHNDGNHVADNNVNENLGKKH